MTLEEALRAALDDEYRARATYRAVIDAYGEVRPFINIVESEERIVLGEDRRPAGILTDRDIALRCVAQGRDPDNTEVGSVMSAPVTCVHDSTPIESALARMAGVHARRLVVVDDAEQLVGVLALDDVLELLAEELTSIGKLLQQRASRSGGY